VKLFEGFYVKNKTSSILHLFDTLFEDWPSIATAESFVLEQCGFIDIIDIIVFII
jgi:hypothetical protein